jgi:DNA-binding NarL/FixJ family response regulator
MLVAASLTNAVLAETLYVSLATANINVNHILGKFHISDKTQTALSAGHHIWYRDKFRQENIYAHCDVLDDPPVS